MLLGQCWPHGARGAAEPQTRACRASCANTRARKRTQARAHSRAGRARLALQMQVRRTLFFSLSLSLSPSLPLIFARSGGARTVCCRCCAQCICLTTRVRVSVGGVRRAPAPAPAVRDAANRPAARPCACVAHSGRTRAPVNPPPSPPPSTPRARIWCALAHLKKRTPAWRRNHRLSEAVVGDVPGEDFKCIDVDLGSTIGSCSLGQVRQQTMTL